MKIAYLLLLTLCATLTSFAQSEPTFTTEELKQIHKQQIRLIYCDSTSSLLRESVNVCNAQKATLTGVISNQKEEIQLIDDYSTKIRGQLTKAESYIKKLERRQKWYKVGMIGTGSAAIILIIFSSTP